jgi:hypothetical protein
MGGHSNGPDGSGAARPRGEIRRIQYRQAGTTAWTAATAAPYDSLMTLTQWRCRICGFDRYHRVSVLRKNGSRYETEFHACSQCSVMFLSPAHFDENSQASANIEVSPTVITPLRRRRP